MVDWNDFGIDENALSTVVHGAPEDWFAPYGWRVLGTERGMEWEDVTRIVTEVARGENAAKTPSMAWFKTRKGRGYGKYDYKSHGSPHAMNSEPFWALRKDFMKKYGVEYQGVDEPPPADPAALVAQARRNFTVAASALRARPEIVTYLSDRLSAVAETVPERTATFSLGGKGTEIFRDERLFDASRYPEAMWAKPGDKKPNRAALATWGSWINSYAKKEYGRPLFIAMSADLAESTNIAGFMKGFGDMEGWGWYQRDTNPRGTLLPQQITEFTNAGIACGIASVNLADDTFTDFNGFWGACSTYGSFSYLKYGEMRLFSQLAQDCEEQLGKVLWIAGHSGPETAEDSRTHFGIFETGVTQLFPDGAVIDLHPWEHNEVPVMLAAAFRERRHPRPAGARDAIAHRGRERCVRHACVSQRPTAHGHGLRAGNDEHGQPGEDPAEARGEAAQREDRRGAEPAALRAPGCGVPRERRLAGGSHRRDGHQQPRAPCDVRLDRAPHRRRVLAHLRLGRPLAHWRHRRRGHRRSAPRTGTAP